MRIVSKFFQIAILLFLITSCNVSNVKPTPIVELPPESLTQNIPEVPKPKKIKVAILVPLSGKYKDLGQSLFNSAMLSLFDNDKNSDLELVVIDSKGTTSGANDAIKEIEKQNIKIIIGPVFSNLIDPIAGTIKSSKITALSFSNNQELMDKKGVFLLGFLPEQQIEKIVSYSMMRGRYNFAAILPNNQYGQKLSNLFRTAVSGKDGNFIANEFYQNNNKDLERSINRILGSFIVPEGKDREAITENDKIYLNTIFIPESGAVLSKIAGLIKKLNTKERDIQIIGSSSWDDTSTLNDGNLSGGWFAAPDSSKYKEFEKRYYSIYGKFPVRMDSIAYDAVLAISELVNVTGKRDLTYNDFINYNGKKNGFEGVDGLFRFLPNGLVQRNFAILEVGNGKFNMIESPSPIFLKY